MKKVKIGLLTGLLVISFLLASAQTETDSTIVQVETVDGNVFVGKIISDKTDKLVLLTEKLGEITIQVTDIKSRQVVQSRQIINGKWWFDNPQSTRYFWAPNGYGLNKGEGYYHNIWVLWNQFAYGVTDNFSIGGAVIPLFLFGGAPTPVFISPKISIPVEKDKLNIGAGALIGTVLGESEGSFGIVYGISTFGSQERNISIGAGYGFSSGEWASSPLINVSGITRLSPRWYLLSENHLIIAEGEAGGLIGGGARWIIKKTALDFGLFIPVASGLDVIIALPWAGFSIPF